MVQTRESAQARAQRLAATRRGQILDAATAVFAEKGFPRATIKEVARRAGVADGTIYIYFPSKTALLMGILDRMNESDRREADLAPGLAGDFESFFAVYLDHRLAVMAPSFEMLRAVLPELLVDTELRELYFERVIAPTLALGERYIQTLIEQGRLRQTDAALATRSISAGPGVLGAADARRRLSPRTRQPGRPACRAPLRGPAPR